MAKIPYVGKEKFTRVRSPLESKQGIYIEGTDVVLKDGSKLHSTTREGAFKLFKKAKKEAGEWY